MKSLTEAQKELSVSLSSFSIADMGFDPYLSVESPFDAKKILTSGELASEVAKVMRWRDFTPAPVVSGGTVPTYTLSYFSKYTVINDTCKYNLYWDNTVGGTAGAGTNDLCFHLPVQPNSRWYSMALGEGNYYNSDVDGGQIWVKFNSTTKLFYFEDAWGTHLTGDNQNNADRTIMITGSFEVV